MYHKTIKVFFSYSTSQAQESFGGGLSKYLHSLENCLSCQFVKMKGNWPLLTNWNATTELMNEAMANTIPKVHTDECLHFYAKTPDFAYLRTYILATLFTSFSV